MCLCHFLHVVMSCFSTGTYVYKFCRISMAKYVPSKSWTPSWILHLYWYSIPHIQLKLSVTSWFIMVPWYVPSVLWYFSLLFVDIWGTKSTPRTEKLNTGLNKYGILFNNSTFCYIAFIHRLIGLLKPKNNAINNKNTSATTLSLASKIE